MKHPETYDLFPILVQKYSIINDSVILEDIFANEDLGEHQLLIDSKRSKESYIVYNEGYEVIAEKIRKYFLDNGITLIGRFGYFEYVNVDMALDRVVNIISKKYNKNRKYLFNLALNKISKSKNYDNS